MDPKLSIIIPTYKRPDKLTRALLSIDEALRTSLEIIVVDDCEKMSAAAVVMNFEEVRYICKRGCQRGLSKSRNIGIKFSTADYIVFIDDDDFFFEGAISHFLDAAEKGIPFFFGNHAILSGDQLNVVNATKGNYENLLISNFLPVGSYMFKRSYLKHFFDERMRTHEDWDFLLSNIKPSDWEFINTPLVCIDKGDDKSEERMTRRLEHRFFADFMCVYSKHPAPTLAHQRSRRLTEFGAIVSPEQLGFDDKN